MDDRPSTLTADEFIDPIYNPKANPDLVAVSKSHVAYYVEKNNPEKDADDFHDCTEGHGTNEAKLIDLLSHRSRYQMRGIGIAFNKKYKHTIEKHMEKDLSGKFRDLAVALCVPYGRYLAERIYDAIHLPGTKEQVLIDVFAHSSNYEIDSIKLHFASIYKHKKPKKEDGTEDVRNIPDKDGKVLVKALEDETSFQLKKALVQLVHANRATNLAETHSVDKDVEALYKAGEKRLGTDDSTFIQILTTRTFGHLEKVKAAYQAKYKKTLTEVIGSETSGAYKNLLTALVTPKAEYWAKRANDAIAGLGTNDKLLIALFVQNTKPELKEVEKHYAKMYPGKDLKTDVAGDTSAHYKKLLLALLAD